MLSTALAVVVPAMAFVMKPGLIAQTVVMHFLSARVRPEDGGGGRGTSGRNVNGEGSVYERKDGRWVAAAYVPAVGGTVHRVSSYAKTRAEGNKNVDLLRAIESAGPDQL